MLRPDELKLLKDGLEQPPTSAMCARAWALALPLLESDLSFTATSRQDAVESLLLVHAHLYRSDAIDQSAIVLAQAARLANGLEPHWLVTVALHQGELELLRRNVGEALKHVAVALQLAQSERLVTEEGRAWLNYALALQAAGIYPRAEALFDRALDLFDLADDPYLRANVWSWRVRLRAHVLQSDYAAARHACEESIKFGLLCAPRVRESVVVGAYCNWAALELLQGNAPAAQALLDQARRLSNVNERTRWLISLIEIFMTIATQQSDTADRRLEAALSAPDAPPAGYIEEALSVGAELYAALGRSGRAVELLSTLAIRRAKVFQALIRDEAATKTIGAAGVEQGRSILEQTAVVAELRDDSTGRHCFRVGRMAVLIAEKAGVSPDIKMQIDVAGRLHDIGKVAIPDAILLKRGKLNDAERLLMQTHTVVGADLLQGIEDPVISMAQTIALYHHEWWNGAGYPRGLAKDAIPLAARITALADVFDALTHVRSYKEAWSIDDALAHITTLRGVQFDPLLTDVFVRLINEARPDWNTFYDYLESGGDQSAMVQAQAILDRS